MPITPLMNSRYKFIGAMLDRFADADKTTCLEIGCGVGDFLKILEKRPFTKIKGLDRSGKNVEIAQKGTRRAEVMQSDLFKVREKFDIVIMLEVLEHIKDDEGALRHISGNLITDKGLLILSVPSHNAPNVLSFGHFRHYEKEKLRRMVEDAGFKVRLFYSQGTQFINNLGIWLLKKRYSKRADESVLTDESARLDFPFVWKWVLFPIMSPFYAIFYLIDYYFVKDTDEGIDYLVLCEKIR